MVEESSMNFAKRLTALSLVSTSLAVMLSACSPAPAAPTTAPAKPTEPAKPAAAASPSEPSASPQAKPAASPAASPAAAAGPSQLSGRIRIVSSFPRTGSGKGQSDAIVNGIKMALEEANMRVDGATLDFEDMDDATPAKGAWDAGKEAENANKAVNDPDVMAYIGTFNSGAAKVAIPILNRANLLMISPANTYPGLTKKVEGVEPNEPDVYYPTGQRNYARVVPPDDLQGSVGANWAKQLGVQRVYILHDTELYGNGLAVVFNNTAPKVGLNVVGGPEGIDPRASDYRALATKIRGSNPDLIYFGGITQNQVGKLLKDIRSTIGNNVKFMGPDGIYERAFIDDAGDAAEGTYITFGGIPPSKLTGKGAEWYQTFKAKYGEPEAYAAYGYESGRVVLDGIKRAGVKDRVKIRDAVFATRDYDGVLGNRWSFDQNGDTSLTAMSGRQVKDGKFDDENAVTLQTPQ
jgi:branched-chain amino acid transport system substrate-binding protein